MLQLLLHPVHLVERTSEKNLLHRVHPAALRSHGRELVHLRAELPPRDRIHAHRRGDRKHRRRPHRSLRIEHLLADPVRGDVDENLRAARLRAHGRCTRRVDRSRKRVPVSRDLDPASARGRRFPHALVLARAIPAHYRRAQKRRDRHERADIGRAVVAHLRARLERTVRLTAQDVDLHPLLALRDHLRKRAWTIRGRHPNRRPTWPHGRRRRRDRVGKLCRAYPRVRVRLHRRDLGIGPNTRLLSDLILALGRVRRFSRRFLPHRWCFSHVYFVLLARIGVKRFDLLGTIRNSLRAVRNETVISDKQNKSRQSGPRDAPRCFGQVHARRQVAVRSRLIYETPARSGPLVEALRPQPIRVGGPSRHAALDQRVVERFSLLRPVSACAHAALHTRNDIKTQLPSLWQRLVDHADDLDGAQRRHAASTSRRWTHGVFASTARFRLKRHSPHRLGGE